MCIRDSINTERYADSLKCLRVSIKNKRPGKLTNGVILLHGNARPHVAQTIQDLLGCMKWAVLQHPPYSPDLSPCDYRVFWAIKEITKWMAVHFGH